MPGPTAKPLFVPPAPHEILRALTRKHTAPQRLARRARIILAAAEGLGLTETAERLGISVATVQLWRNRWRQASERLAALADDAEALGPVIEQTLSDQPRSGTPPTFSAEQVAQIIALGCEDPTRYGREVTHWTREELAEEAVNQEIVSSISPRTVGRFLKRSRPQAASEPILAQPRT